ncbi:MAG: tRNA uracil 4-sulfurtransferase ThiI [Acidilobaceae archaeon]
MSNVILVRYGEIAIKGVRTRRSMENLLANTLRLALEKFNVKAEITVSEGRIFIWNPSDIEGAIKASSRVFGVKSISPAYFLKFSDLEDLIDRALEFFSPRVKGKIFRVRARRVGSHNFTSKDVEKLLGSKLLESGALKVDLENPEYTAYLEIRGLKAFLYDTIIDGPGGLPLGSEGTVLVLFSGGFDSTVTSWRLMKRGCRVHLLHYDLGFPETVRVAIEVAKYLADNWSFGHSMRLFIINFRGPVRIVNGLVSPPYRTLVIRRLMMEYAVSLAEKIGAEAIATGESIGQVASQTIRNLYLLGRNLRLPVLRPLLGSDKDEIIKESIRIGTYDLNKKQVEVCGLAATPTPRGNPKRFEKEYDKVSDIIVPDPIEINLTSESLDSILSKLKLG